VAKKKPKHIGKRRDPQPAEKNDAFSLDKWLSRFGEAVSEATNSIYEKRKATKTIDVLEVLIEPIFFRNCHIYETIIYLLDTQYIFGAELLLRCLLEGTVILQWCLVEPRDRGQRLAKHIWSGEIGLADKSFFKLSADDEDLLRDCIAALDEDGVKLLPPLRQMMESVYRYRKDYAYAKKDAYTLYSYLSKNIHGVGLDPQDFLCTQGDEAEVCRIKTQPSPKRTIACRVLACVLQMDNIRAISSFDKAIRCDKLYELDEMWATLYVLLEAEGH
jgi:hypothetical protein